MGRLLIATILIAWAVLAANNIEDDISPDAQTNTHASAMLEALEAEGL